MIKEKYIDLVSGYLQDTLSPEERAELNSLIKKGEIDLRDLKKMALLYKKTDDLPAPAPSEAMRTNFYRLLDDEKKAQHLSLLDKVRHFAQTLHSQIKWRPVAGAIALFFVGILVGNLTTPFKNYHQQLDHLSNEVSQMRQVVALNLMDDASPTERLKAVNISMDVTSDNQKVIRALLKTLNNDSNINVRLAAVEALIRRGDNAKVRKGLVRSINRQPSPLVQAALADAMLALQETDSVKELKELLHKDDLDGSVRKKLQHTIAVLS